MIVSDIKKRFYLELSIFALLNFCSFSVQAKPIELIPDDKSAASKENTIDDVIVEEEAEPLEENIVIDSLDDINIENTGIFSDGNSVYNFNIWNNAEADEIDFIFKHINFDFKINYFNKVFRKLLTLSAAPPKNSQDFLYNRIQTLINKGVTQDALKLINTAGLKNFGDKIKPKIHRSYLLSSLIEGDNVCSRLKYFSELDSVNGQKLGIICELQKDQKDKALLKVNLLRDSGYKDEIFYNIVEYISGASLEKPKINDIISSPYNLAAAINSKELFERLPEDASVFWFYKIISNNDVVPVVSKIKNAEKALVAGASDVENLQKIYLSAPFSEGALKSPLTTADKITPEMGRALLYQSAINRKTDVEKAEIIAKAFSLEKDKSKFIITALVYNDIIEEMEFSKNLKWFFDYAAVSKIYAGKLDNIDKVFDINETLKTQNTSLSTVLKDFWQIKFSPEFTAESLQILSCDTLENSVLFNIEQAAINKDIGKFLLLVTATFSKIDCTTICPNVLSYILRQLSVLGFEKEARIIAYQVLTENTILLNWLK